MFGEQAYDEVEPRKTRKGETLPREVDLPDVHQDVYEENNIDGTFQAMSRSCTIFYSLPKLGFHVPHSFCSIFSTDDSDDHYYEIFPSMHRRKA